MKRLMRPGVLIPATLSVALLVALLSFGNVRAMLGIMTTFDRTQLWWYLLLMLVYETARAATWLFLLARLQVRVPLSSKMLSFLGGEVTKSLPLGNFFPNYLLQLTSGADFGLTSAASTVIILFEIVVSLIVVVILGLGTWTGVLRAVIIGGAIFAAILAWILYKLRRRLALPSRLWQSAAFRTLVKEWRWFKTGMGQLLRPSTLIIGSLLCATYLLAGGALLYLVARGMRLEGIALTETIAIYCLTLAFTLIEPTPVDLGFLEVAGTGAFILVGLDRDSAIAIMLMSRVLSVAFTLAIVFVSVLVLHRAVVSLIRRRHHHPNPVP